MFYVDETLVEGCSREAKSNAPRIHNVQKLEAKKQAFGVDATLLFFAKPILRDRAISHPRSSPAGPALFGSVRVGSAPKVGIWCRRDVTFPK